MIFSFYQTTKRYISVHLQLFSLGTLQSIVEQMTFIFFISALSLSILYVSGQTYSGVYALSWLAGFCLDEVHNRRQACDQKQVALWDSQSFTIHGLWPDVTTTSSFGAFSLPLIQKQTQLLDNMHNYWPPKSKASSTSVFLWQHQWDVHGKDYAAILFKLKPESFPGTVDVRNAALQTAFYKDVIGFYQRFHVTKLSSGTFTKAALAKAIGVAENQFVCLCTSSNIVKQLQICFDITKTGISLRACTKTTNCAGGGQTIQLVDWKVKGQSRVTNYPTSLALQSQ